MRLGFGFSSSVLRGGACLAGRRDDAARRDVMRLLIIEGRGRRERRWESKRNFF